MKSNKILYIVIGVVVLSVMIAVGVLFMSINKSGNKMTNGMNEVAKAYIQSVNTGEYDKAYEKLSSMSKGYVDLESYSKLMSIMMEEKDTRIEIDESKKAKQVEQAIGEQKMIYTGVPISRVYVKTLDGVATTIKDELMLGIVDEAGVYKIYIPEETYYDYINQYVVGKANEFAIEALENKNNTNIVTKNAEKIEEYLNFAQKVPSSYKNYSDVVLQIDLITAYKLLSQGDQNGAINRVKSSYIRAESKEQKLRIYRVESEIYYAAGQYSEAVEVLKEALEVDPNNGDIRRDYRRINSMVIEQIESALTRGWSQLQSAIKQEEKEMDRILSDIALVEAETAISIKKDAPDGYYLKGNIEYCLGDYQRAIESLEKAVELSKVEDTEFRTKAAEILGMTRVAQASSNKEKDIKSYQSIFNKDLRSLLFRESEVSGIVDTIK